MTKHNFAFKDYLTDKVKPLYTQMLNGEKIHQHDVVYIFDEVGCGKTITAIIAMASLIKENPVHKILVLTPKPVCSQFEKEISEKLKISILNTTVHSIGSKTSKQIKKLIDDLQNKNYIFVANPHKAEKLKSIIWDLIIIDEANTIVCNNQLQDKYLSVHPSYLYEKNDNTLKGDSSSNIEVRNYRFNNTELFRHVCNLSSKKLMFLSATPFGYNKELDTINYKFMTTWILRKTSSPSFFDSKLAPGFDWLSAFYSNTCNVIAIKEMENANTSFMFKEIANSVPIASSSSQTVQPKTRRVLVWNEDETNSVLRTKIFDILAKPVEQTDTILKNRFIIFVSNSKEGEMIFKKLFPESNDNILEADHKSSDTLFSCEFIMNKFGNASRLECFKEEKKEIPDILIVSWQVAQVGINLPTFNHIINYHIPKKPGHLEQRYGRIDRLNTLYNELYNIYYIDDIFNSSIYHANLLDALWKYQNNIFNCSNASPVKNLLLCKDLEISTISDTRLYETLLNTIIRFLMQNENHTLEDIKSDLNKTKWNTRSMKWDNLLQILTIEHDSYELSNHFIDDERNTTNIETDTSREIISILCHYIDKIDTYNQHAIALRNHPQLDNAGTLIFINNSDSKNEKNHQVIINVTDIAAKLIQHLNSSEQH